MSDGLKIMSRCAGVMFFLCFLLSLSSLVWVEFDLLLKYFAIGSYLIGLGIFAVAVAKKDVSDDLLNSIMPLGLLCVFLSVLIFGW